MLFHLLLGGNVGDRRAYLAAAIAAIEREVGAVVAASNLYETEPWGVLSPQQNYYNQAISVESEFAPLIFLAKILQIETTLGRVRSAEERNAARTIDIDILLIETQIIDTDALQAPHPRLHLRRFALLPLADIAAEVIHPILQKNIGTLLNECADTGAVLRVEGK